MLAHDAFFTEDKVLSKTLIKKHQCEIFVSRCYASEAYVVMRCLCVCVCVCVCVRHVRAFCQNE